MTNHPSNIRCAPKNLASFYTVNSFHTVLQRHRVTAVVSHNTLGFTGRTRSVKNVKGISCQHRHAIRHFTIRVSQRLIPIKIACTHRSLALRSLKDDAGFRLVRCEINRFINKRFVGNRVRELNTAGSRQQNPRFRIINSRRQLPCSKTAEDHRVHCTYARTGEHCYGRFRNHRHIDDNSIALYDTEVLKSASKKCDIVSQLSIGICLYGVRDRRVINQCRLIRPAVVDMEIERDVRRV